MKLNYDRKSKDPTYFIQVGIRNGKKVTTKNVERIGKHSELLKITDDPLEYAKQRVKEYNENIKNSKVEYNITVNFDDKVINQGNTVSKSTCKNTGYFYLKELYSSLGISDFFDKVCSGRKIAFNPNMINMVLTFSRILDPGSKMHTLKNLTGFYGDFDFSHQDILRFMDILEENYDEYISHLFESSNKVIKRNTNVCYFDCTNFYFEKESEDEDVYDEITGELIKGLLKYGVSKEHRPNPIVQMGLFMDADGIPLSMCINPGSDNESLCAVPAEKKMLKMFENKDIIYCSDAGLGYNDTRLFNDFGGRKFVVTQSIKKLNNILKQAVFNDYDYRFSQDGKPASLETMKTFDRTLQENRKYYDGYIYKSIPVDKLVDLGLFEVKQYKNGKTKKVKSKGNLKQRIIVTYSRKMAEYQKTVRNRQIERAKKILANMDPDNFKKGPNDVTRFIKSDKEKKNYYLDEARIEEEAKYDGFYAVATNIFDMKETEVLDIQSRRYKIEDCFRVLKANFSSRPVYHRKENRIKAHFLICYTALLIYRLLEVKLDRNKTHFTTEQIIETLQNMNVVNCSDMYYQACYTGSDVLDSLEQLFDLKLNRKYYQPKTLNKFKKI
ncbi:transposase [uncultured Holdemanella sp.]|uniref:IS1634 family transposase n=1 Tax=uncultured Holdemanella sp. TaxID=1763549 RepID=UPI0025E3F1C3|nr:transposase [uncultured Holdemanella sp.]